MSLGHRAALIFCVWALFVPDKDGYHARDVFPTYRECHQAMQDLAIPRAACVDWRASVKRGLDRMPR